MARDKIQQSLFIYNNQSLNRNEWIFINMTKIHQSQTQKQEYDKWRKNLEVLLKSETRNGWPH